MKFSHLFTLTTVITLLLIFTGDARAATFIVANTNDGGAGSFRQAISDANANSGLDTITFNIGSGVQTINPLTQLPEVTDPVLIDGTTQPGFSGTPLIVLSGSSVTGSGDVYGLHLTGGNSTVKSMIIINFNNPAPQAIRIDTNGGNIVQGCYIGVDATGTTRARNWMGIVIASSDNLIGGPSPQARNVISGSNFDNINILGAASNNRIEGNYIGTNASGTASMNGGGYGIEVASTGSNNKIGGTTFGTGNLISGNGQSGIRASALGTVIQGNFIGTDATGTLSVGNTNYGVILEAFDGLLGGNTPAARNVISGNGGGGVSAGAFADTQLPKIQGNYIGVDVTGRNALPNAGLGLSAGGPVIIGGAGSGEGNVIGANSSGISLGSGAVTTTGAVVQGNLIGTDVTGTADLGNGSGITIASSNNTIGGPQPGARNIISGNAVGIQIGGTTTATIGNNVIQGNFIGTDRTGTQPLANSSRGIVVNGSANNKIGGVNPGEGNVIAYNGVGGILMTPFIQSGSGNDVRRNSIFQNGGLGIDLNPVNVTANDNCDADTGPNNLQNFPVLTSISSNNGLTTVTGNLNSTADSVFNIEFFANPTPDASGNGEGKIYIGTTTVTTNAGCNAAINVNLNSQNVGNLFITATATDASGNTSEFSSAVRATGTSGKGFFDFDGDGKTDLSIFRPSAGEWWYLRTSDGGNYAAQFGAGTDKITPGDFTGDGKTDIAFWRPSNGFWFVLRSEDQSYYSFPFGTTGDLPAVGDFDGDGKADATIFRPSNSTWYISKSSGGTLIQQFGQNGDVPVVADYDGDGTADIAIYRVALGEWWIQRSTAGLIAFQFGNSSDKPVPGDFTGDGKADVALFRPSTGEWFVLRSEDQSYYSFPFGTNGDIPAPGDYDGDGKFDATVFRPSSSTWYAQRSTAGTLIQTFGQSGDTPVPSSFVP